MGCQIALAARVERRAQLMLAGKENPNTPRESLRHRSKRSTARSFVTSLITTRATLRVSKNPVPDTPPLAVVDGDAAVSVAIGGHTRVSMRSVSPVGVFSLVERFSITL